MTYFNLNRQYLEIIFPEIKQGRLTGIAKQQLGLKEADTFNYVDIVYKLEEELSHVETHQIKQSQERAILVGSKEESLKELKNLTTTAKVEVVTNLTIRDRVVDPAYYIGQGKVSQIKRTLINQQANVIIFDDELTPAQYSNLEEGLGVKVIDRTQLILDIFAQQAQTKEGQLQVELAQLKYLLPRLIGQGAKMSRLGGGIGTRGPGETKLEIDRRRIRKRIHRLKKDLKKIRKNRQLQRKNRRHPVISLVGYTNAGKSTVMNLLTKAEVEAKGRLFATLDSTLRQIKLPIGRQVIVSDTVGFIKKLPHDLIAAFKATLEEIKEANLLLHVVDSSHPNLKERMAVVHDELEDLGVLDKEIITVFNKADLVADNKLDLLQRDYPNSVVISALHGKGKERLLNKISSFIVQGMIKVKLKLSYDKANWLDRIYQEGRVLNRSYDNQGIKLEAQIPNRLAAKLKKYKI
ncbi:GTPase HflX [Halobacteroides halobius]|uniref:GTPase HflX n=1 Tax=Halobacteroides halobius TaxID=42422 RepID=UPI0002E49A6F|nr:GTPase HflX [Halobacteroides halobius]